MGVDAGSRPHDRPVLSLAELEAFDPHAPAGGAKRRFCCPLPGPCAAKRVDGAHRALEVETTTGAWRCYRCHTWGRLREYWQPREARRGAAMRRAFGLDPAPATWWPPAPPASGKRSTPAAPPPTERSRPGTPLAPPRSATPPGAVTAPRPAFDWRGAFAAAAEIDQTRAARTYLERRGIPVELAAAAGVHGTPVWYGRPAVLFPLHDRAGDLVAVAGRYLDGRPPKARTGGRVSAGVFATPGARAAERLFICEAPIDALSLAACGLPALATCGTHWPDWLPRLAAFRPVVVAFDADAAGDACAAKLSAALRGYGARVERWRPADAKDWNELLTRHGQERLRMELFLGDAGARYRAVWERLALQYDGAPPAPHPALERAIDAGDWTAFARELAVWEQRASGVGAADGAA